MDRSSNRLTQEDQYKNNKLQLKMQTGVLLLLDANGNEISRTPGSPEGKVIDYTPTVYPTGQRTEQIGDLELDATHYPLKVPVDSALDLLSQHPIGNDAVTAEINATNNSVALLDARVTVNEEDIDDLETSKVNVADIVDDLTSTDADKPLSAKQGKVLKELIENSIQDFFDQMHPVGSYAFGATAPTLGTWEEVEGDRALWLKNTVADGTEIAEGLPSLPSITIDNSGNHAHTLPSAFTPNVARSGWSEFAGTGAAADAGQTRDNGTHTHTASYGASSIYGGSTNVQPNAYVIKVWKRTS